MGFDPGMQLTVPHNGTVAVSTRPDHFICSWPVLCMTCSKSLSSMFFLGAAPPWLGLPMYTLFLKGEAFC